MHKEKLKQDCQKIEERYPGTRVVVFDATCDPDESCVIYGIAWVDEMMTRWEDMDGDDESDLG